MQVLVTGGAGYVGSALTEALITRGHHVTVLDRMIFGVPPLTTNDRLAVYKADVRDSEAIDSLLAGQHAVVHLAFASNDPGYRLEPAIAKAVNIAPLKVLLKGIAEHAVQRFVFLSSCSVYGHNTRGELDEATATGPLTAYAEHKLTCERIINAFADQGAFNGTILRPATLCGTSPRQRLDLFLNRMMAEAVYNGTIKISAAVKRRPVLPLAELIDVILEILDAPIEAVGGQTFNVAFENATVAEWADTVAGISGAKVKAIQSDDQPADGRSYSVSSNKLMNTISYEPKHNVKRSLDDLRFALESGDFPNALANAKWHNLLMQSRHDFDHRLALTRLL